MSTGATLPTSRQIYKVGGCLLSVSCLRHELMEAVGFTGSTAEVIGLIAASFVLAFMVVGSLFADIIDRRTILLIAASVLFVCAIP